MTAAVLIAADTEPPGQPYISPDDLAAIGPLWDKAVEEHLMPLVAEVWDDSAGMIHAEMLDASDVEFPFPSVGSVTAEAYLGQARNVYGFVGDELWQTARAQLEEGFAAGESIPQLVDRLQASAGLTARRATLVARSTVIEASNAGAIATARAAGIDMQKEWVATPDERTRKTHHTADGQKVGLADPFTVGGFSADVPGDPGLPPQEKYNCRCTIGFVMADAVAKKAKRDAQPELPLPGTSGIESSTSDTAELTGANGFSADPAERAVQIENQIRVTYRELVNKGGDLASLALLRDRLPGDIPRPELDQTLKAMDRRRDLQLEPDPNRKALPPEAHAAAIRIGGEDKHLLTMRNSSLRQLPGKAIASQTPAGAAVTARERAATRKAARARQKAIADTEPYADFAAEVDRIAFLRRGQRFDSEAERIFRQRVDLLETSGIPGAELAPMRAAIKARRISQVRAEAKKLAVARGLSPIGKAGQRVAFDENLHEPLVEGTVFGDGELVEIYQQGHVVKIGEDMIELDRAKVIRIDRPLPGTLTAAADVQTGAMVALVPADAECARLAVEEGEPADQLHMTGLYLGDAADWTPEEQAALVDAARQCSAGVEPFTADGFALSMFNPTGPDPCCVLGLSGDAVAEFYTALDAAFEPFASRMPAQHLPRVPHMTLIYTEDPEWVADLIDRCGPVVFDRLRVAFAGQVIDIPLGAAHNQPMTAAVADEILLPPVEDVLPEIEDGTPWEGVLAPEGVWSGDGRQFAPDSLEWAPLPLALKWQPEEGPGHDGSVIVGRIDEIWRDGAMIRARGVMDDDGLYGAEALRLMRKRMLRGVSIRGDDTKEIDVELIYPMPAPGMGIGVDLGPDTEYAIQVPDEPVGDVPVILPMPEPEPMGEPDAIVHKGRIRSATLTPEQAFVEAEILLTDMITPAAEEAVPDMATPAPGPTVVTSAAYTITIPELWPEWWFEEPAERPPFGALHITPEGRVFGLLAPAQVSHRAFRASGRTVTAPRGLDYSEFQNKPALVAGADGEVYRINAGTITFDCGHPSPYDPRRQDPAWAMQQYDNTCSVAARVRAGEYADGSGTWVAGALLHGVDADTVERMMACALSVDVQGGKLNAALLVPVEGFPAPVTSSVRIREGALVASSMPIRFTPNVAMSGVDYAPVMERLARSIGRDRGARFAALRDKVKGEGGD